MTLETHVHNHTHIKDNAKNEFLHKKKYVQSLDNTVLFISILSPVMTIPQAWQVWSTHDAKGLSLITWTAWLVFSVFWLLYGLAHKEKPIIVNNILWIFIHISVIIAILLYG